MYAANQKPPIVVGPVLLPLIVAQGCDRVRVIAKWFQPRLRPLLYIHSIEIKDEYFRQSQPTMDSTCDVKVLDKLIHPANGADRNGTSPRTNRFRHVKAIKATRQ